MEKDSQGANRVHFEKWLLRQRACESDWLKASSSSLHGSEPMFISCVLCVGRHPGRDRMEASTWRCISSAAAHQVTGSSHRLGNSDPLCCICRHRWEFLWFIWNVGWMLFIQHPANGTNNVGTYFGDLYWQTFCRSSMKDGWVVNQNSEVVVS